jgi:hypothetical protein
MVFTIVLNPFGNGVSECDWVQLGKMLNRMRTHHHLQEKLSHLRGSHVPNTTTNQCILKALLDFTTVHFYVPGALTLIGFFTFFPSLHRYSYLKGIN